MYIADASAVTAPVTDVRAATVPPRRGSDVFVLLVSADAEFEARVSMALQGVLVPGGRIVLLPATSSSDAFSALAANPSVAVAIVGVGSLMVAGRPPRFEGLCRALEQSEVRVIRACGYSFDAGESRVGVEQGWEDYLVDVIAAAALARQKREQSRFAERFMGWSLDVLESWMSTGSLQEFSTRLREGLATLLQCSAAGATWLARDGERLVLIENGNGGLTPSELDPDGSRLSMRLLAERCYRGRDWMLCERGSALLLKAQQDCHLIVVLVDPRAARALQNLRFRGEEQVLRRMVGVCIERLNLLRQAERQLYLDALVALPSRAALIKEMDSRLATTRPFQLLLLDIDSFSDINQTFGARFADRVLDALSRRLLGEFRNAGEMVARLGGDEFAILGGTDGGLVARVSACLKNPVAIGNECVLLSGCIGTLRSADADSGIDAIGKASMAIKAAKAEGLGKYVDYDHQVGAEALDRMRILSQVSSAIQQERLGLEFQPQFCMRSLKVVGVEALLRCVDSRGEPIDPATFVALSERSGLIRPIGAWVFRRALQARRALQEAGMPLRMSINVSSIELEAAGFVDGVREVLQQEGADAAGLEFEVTESSEIRDLKRTCGTLRELRELGFSIALDDFGSGYSSLAILQVLPINRVKVDKAFLLSPLDSVPSWGLVSTIVQMGRDLGCAVLVEGIESAMHCQRLRDIGCDEGQGFHLGRPMTLQRLLDWLPEHGAASAAQAPVIGSAARLPRSGSQLGANRRGRR